MTNALNYHDLRRAAKRRLPRGVFEYIDRGSEDETALKQTREAFESRRIAPRALVVGERSTKLSLFGEDYELPIVAAPTAFAGLVWRDGELELARAADAAGAPYCAATSAIASVEKIAAASQRPIWFQLYLWEQEELWRDLVARAWAAGVRTLVLTIDTNVPPKREFNARNGFGMPFRFTPRNVADVLLHPRWAAQVLLRPLAQGGWPALENYPPSHRPNILAQNGAAKLRHHPELSWDHVRKLRDAWKGSLVLKGVLRVEDAIRAAELGVDGVVVSNHGARNLDSVVAPISVLASISEAVGDKLTILADSGVQRGSDVFKLLAHGAKAVLVGRAFLYGTAAGGRDGAAQAIEILRDELATTMIFAGYPSLEALRAGVDRAALAEQERRRALIF